MPCRPDCWQTLACLITFCVAGGAGTHSNAAETDTKMQNCVQQQVLNPDHHNLVITDLFDICEQQLSSNLHVPGTDIATDAPDNSAVVVPAANLSRFFRPYKDNYIIFGQARTADGSPPFSGERLDIKFELGMTFNVFDEISDLTFLAPLSFGYAQRSWWDVSKDSQPFAEHNYNPEIFWRLTQPERRLNGNFSLVDIIGAEHQSNGLSGPGSRSWDRAYVKKEFTMLPRLNVDVKLWHAFGEDANNEDITDYLGQGEVTLKFSPNERTLVRLRVIKGIEVQKYSYQFDISYRRPWVNSAFFISYHDGYGEALISYNQKTRSLRAGLYFPLEVLSR